MGQTDVYDLRWPELGDPSDGPDGWQDLAKDTEAALLGLRDNADDIAYTPTWRSAGNIQPYGMSWNARYSVRGKRCFVSAFGQMSTSTSGGTGWFLIGLPVRSRASIPEQVLSAKLYVNDQAYAGWAYLSAGAIECIPYFPVNQSRSDMTGWASANESGQAGTGFPNFPGKYSVGGSGNFSLFGSYLI